MNVIWGMMILTGLAYGIATGRADAVSEAMLSSVKEAVNLCVTMLGVLAFWMGIMEIAKEEGCIRFLSGKIRPLVKFLFPKIPEGHPALEHITMNCVSNLLGLGWAATPAGLKAMESLEMLEEERRKKKQPAVPKGTASNEMCTFLIINISSLQLIPVNVIAYRAQYGSVDPNAVVGPGIAATLISTLAAVFFCKLADRRNKV